MNMIRALVIGVCYMLLPLTFVSVAQAASYDLTATFSAPADGGPVTGYRLYRGCDNLATKTLVGAIVSGQPLAGALPNQGQHYLCVAAYNATGEGLITEVVSIDINDFDPVPGAVQGLQFNIGCDASCNVTITTQPAQ